jgi:voltage-gated potassium channel
MKTSEASKIRTRLSWMKNVSIAIFTIVSILFLFADYLFPLTAIQRHYIYIFDFLVVVVLALDYSHRLYKAPRKRRFVTEHWYELPAMVPLFVTGSFGYLRFIEFFRLVRLYNVLSILKGRELVLLASLSLISIIFGALGVYLVESAHPNSNIKNIYDAFWWSVETITTVTYGEYYPVTAMGRVIAGVTMFAAIGFLWTFVGLVGSSLVTRKVREASNQQQKEQQLQLLQLRTLPKPTVANETKELIKNKIDILDSLDDKDLEDLIKLIRMINSDKRTKLADEVVQQNQARRTVL